MRYKQLGKTGLEISVIGIGGGVFNPSKDPLLTEEKVREALSLWIEGGVNVLDWGKDYGENFLKKVLDKKLHLILRAKAKTKEEILEKIQESRKVLGVPKISVYEIFLDSMEDLKMAIDGGVFEGLEEAKRKGWIEATGIFSHDFKVLEKSIEKVDVVALLYNVVHRMGEKLIEKAHEKGKGVIAMAPLATGILAPPIPEFKNEMISAKNALKFVLSNPNVDCVMVGAKKKEHIEELLKIGSEEWKLEDEERENIVKNYNEFLGENFCRMCRLCECPKGIPIPDILKLQILAKNYGCVDFAKWCYSSFKEIVMKCDECGVCEEKCPYGVRVRESLREIKKLLG